MIIEGCLFHRFICDEEEIGGGAINSREAVIEDCGFLECINKSRDLLIAAPTLRAELIGCSDDLYDGETLEWTFSAARSVCLHSFVTHSTK